MFVYSQVQLLVTSQDVDNYKQIKFDLDQLRSIVEKSELWVYKRQGSEESMDAGEGLCAEPEHKLVPYFKNSVSGQCFFCFLFFFYNHNLSLSCCRAMREAQTGPRNPKAPAVTTTGW